MLTVVRLADYSYCAYCVPTGFLAHGNLRQISTALESIGLKKHEIRSILKALDSPAEVAEELDIPLLLQQALRQKARSRQV